jgi:hypothetical protein
VTAANGNGGGSSSVATLRAKPSATPSANVTIGATAFAKAGNQTLGNGSYVGSITVTLAAHN